MPGDVGQGGVCGCGRTGAATAPPLLGQVGIQFGRHVALVSQDDQAGAVGNQLRVVIERGPQDLALIDLRAANAQVIGSLPRWSSILT